MGGQQDVDDRYRGHFAHSKKDHAPQGGRRRGARPPSRREIRPLRPLGQEERRSFLDAVSSLSHQVRTANTTGKIQELRSQVSSGEYRVDAREVAARMLLMEVDE